jgi:uncharacterized membrane protein YhaH (DUF805 family)
VIGFVEAIRNGFEQYASARGRASRAEYWWWWLATGLVSLLTEGTALGTLLVLAIVLPTLTVLIRRLHDTGRSGWWALIAFVPAIGVLVLLFFLVLPGDATSNRYGPPRVPSASSGGTSAGFGGSGRFNGGDPGPRGGTSGGSSAPDAPSPGGWPHGGDTPPRSSGWDDLPPPPPSSR